MGMRMTFLENDEYFYREGRIFVSYHVSGALKIELFHKVLKSHQYNMYIFVFLYNRIYITPTSPTKVA